MGRGAGGDRGVAGCRWGSGSGGVRGEPGLATKSLTVLEQANVWTTQNGLFPLFLLFLGLRGGHVEWWQTWEHGEMSGFMM